MLRTYGFLPVCSTKMDLCQIHCALIVQRARATRSKVKLLALIALLVLLLPQRVVSIAFNVIPGNFRIKMQCRTAIIATQEHMLHYQDLKHVQTVMRANYRRVQLCNAMSVTRASTRQASALQSALIVRPARLLPQNLLQRVPRVIFSNIKKNPVKQYVIPVIKASIPHLAHLFATPVVRGNI